MDSDSSDGKILKKRIAIILTGALIAFSTVTTANFQMANALSYDFAVQFGTAGLDEGIGVATDSGAVYVVGHVSGALPGQIYFGSDDAFIRKYDTDGNVVWTRQFGTSGSDVADKASIDSSGVYVVGRTSGSLALTNLGDYDAFIRKYDTDGNVVWTRQFGNSTIDEALHVAVYSGRVYVVGYTYGALPGYTNAGVQDAFIVKYDTDGNEIWTRQFGTPAIDSLNAVIVDASGIYAAGLSYGTLPGQTNAGLDDPVVRKYDFDGNVVWTREELGSPNHDNVNDIALDATGVYIVGQTWGILPGQTSVGPPDAYIRKYDKDGNHAWTRQFGTVFLESGSGLALDSTGIYASGLTDGVFPGQTGALPPDAFVAKYDTNGNELLVNNTGTSGVDWAIDLAADSSGIYATGWATGAFPGQTNSGDRDVFLIKIPPPLTINPAASIQQLIDEIDAMEISDGMKSKLISPLEKAVKILEDSKENNDDRACKKLMTFLQKVDVKAKHGKLSMDQADDLRTKAESIAQVLSC